MIKNSSKRFLFWFVLFSFLFQMIPSRFSAGVVTSPIKSKEVTTYCLKEFHHALRGDADDHCRSSLNYFNSSNPNGYTCTVDEMDTTNLCPSGTTVSKSSSVIGYSCYSDESFDFDGCLDGYVLERDYSDGDSYGQFYVHCDMKGYIKKTAVDQDNACGNSGAWPAVEAYTGDGDYYCCQY